MPSTQYTKFFEALAQRPPVPDMSIEETRETFETMMQNYPIPTKVRYEPFRIGSMKACWAFPNDAPRQPIVLYFHGGGYTIGSISSHKAIVGRLAKETNMTHLFFEYRLAPEHPYPAALEDALTVYQWLLRHPYPHNKIALAGDSAGAGLVLALLLRLKLGKLPLPKAAACLCPWVDLSKRVYVDRIDILTPKRLKQASGMYVDKHNPKEPYISPIYGDLSDLPPILLQTGTQELIYEEIIEIAKEIPSGKLAVWQDMVHCWHFFSTDFPEADRGVIEAAEFLKQAFE